MFINGNLHAGLMSLLLNKGPEAYIRPAISGPLKTRTRNRWRDGDGVEMADQYLSKRFGKPSRSLAGSTSTLRKAMKAQRIAGRDFLTPEKLKGRWKKPERARKMAPRRKAR
jgi:hypothetical protein